MADMGYDYLIGFAANTDDLRKVQEQLKNSIQRSITVEADVKINSKQLSEAGSAASHVINDELAAQTAPNVKKLTVEVDGLAAALAKVRSSKSKNTILKDLLGEFAQAFTKVKELERAISEGPSKKLTSQLEKAYGNIHVLLDSSLNGLSKDSLTSQLEKSKDIYLQDMARALKMYQAAVTTAQSVMKQGMISYKLPKGDPMFRDRRKMEIDAKDVINRQGKAWDSARASLETAGNPIIKAFLGEAEAAQEAASATTHAQKSRDNAFKAATRSASEFVGVLNVVYERLLQIDIELAKKGPDADKAFGKMEQSAWRAKEALSVLEKATGKKGRTKRLDDISIIETEKKGTYNERGPSGRFMTKAEKERAAGIYNLPGRTINLKDAAAGKAEADLTAEEKVQRDTYLRNKAYMDMLGARKDLASGVGMRNRRKAAEDLIAAQEAKTRLEAQHQKDLLEGVVVLSKRTDEGAPSVRTRSKESLSRARKVYAENAKYVQAKLAKAEEEQAKSTKPFTQEREYLKLKAKYETTQVSHVNAQATRAAAAERMKVLMAERSVLQKEVGATYARSEAAKAKIPLATTQKETQALIAQGNEYDKLIAKINAKTEAIRNEGLASARTVLASTGIAGLGIPPAGTYKPKLSPFDAMMQSLKEQGMAATWFQQPNAEGTKKSWLSKTFGDVRRTSQINKDKTGVGAESIQGRVYTQFESEMNKYNNMIEKSREARKKLVSDTVSTPLQQARIAAKAAGEQLHATRQIVEKHRAILNKIPIGESERNAVEQSLKSYEKKLQGLDMLSKKESKIYNDMLATQKKHASGWIASKLKTYGGYFLVSQGFWRAQQAIQQSFQEAMNIEQTNVARGLYSTGRPGKPANAFVDKETTDIAIKWGMSLDEITETQALWLKQTDAMAPMQDRLRTSYFLTDQAAQISRLSNTKLADSYDTLTAVIRGLGLSVHDVPHILDVVAAVASKAGAGLIQFKKDTGGYDNMIQQLLQGLENGATVMSKWNMSVEQYTSLIATIQEFTMKSGKEASSDLVIALNQMFDPEVRRKLKDVGIELRGTASDIDYLMDKAQKMGPKFYEILSSLGLKPQTYNVISAITIPTGIARAKELRKAAETVEPGFMGRGAAGMMLTTRAQMEKMQVQLQVMTILIIGKLMPAMQKGATFIGNVLIPVLTKFGGVLTTIIGFLAKYAIFIGIVVGAKALLVKGLTMLVPMLEALGLNFKLLGIQIGSTTGQMVMFGATQRSAVLGAIGSIGALILKYALLYAAVKVVSDLIAENSQYQHNFGMWAAQDIERQIGNNFILSKWYNSAKSSIIADLNKRSRRESKELAVASEVEAVRKTYVGDEGKAQRVEALLRKAYINNKNLKQSELKWLMPILDASQQQSILTEGAKNLEQFNKQYAELMKKAKIESGMEGEVPQEIEQQISETTNAIQEKLAKLSDETIAYKTETAKATHEVNMLSIAEDRLNSIYKDRYVSLEQISKKAELAHQKRFALLKLVSMEHAEELRMIAVNKDIAQNIIPMIPKQFQGAAAAGLAQTIAAQNPTQTLTPAEQAAEEKKAKDNNAESQRLMSALYEKQVKTALLNSSDMEESARKRIEPQINMAVVRELEARGFLQYDKTSGVINLADMNDLRYLNTKTTVDKNNPKKSKTTYTPGKSASKLRLGDALDIAINLVTPWPNGTLNNSTQQIIDKNLIGEFYQPGRMEQMNRVSPPRPLALEPKQVTIAKGAFPTGMKYGISDCNVYVSDRVADLTGQPRGKGVGAYGTKVGGRGYDLDKVATGYYVHMTPTKNKAKDHTTNHWVVIEDSKGTVSQSILGDYSFGKNIRDYKDRIDAVYAPKKRALHPLGTADGTMYTVAPLDQAGIAQATKTGMAKASLNASQVVLANQQKKWGLIEAQAKDKQAIRDVIEYSVLNNMAPELVKYGVAAEWAAESLKRTEERRVEDYEKLYSLPMQQYQHEISLLNTEMGFRGATESITNNLLQKYNSEIDVATKALAKAKENLAYQEKGQSISRRLQRFVQDNSWIGEQVEGIYNKGMANATPGYAIETQVNEFLGKILQEAGFSLDDVGIISKNMRWAALGSAKFIDIIAGAFKGVGTAQNEVNNLTSILQNLNFSKVTEIWNSGLEYINKYKERVFDLEKQNLDKETAAQKFYADMLGIEFNATRTGKEAAARMIDLNKRKIQMSRDIISSIDQEEMESNLTGSSYFIDKRNVQIGIINSLELENSTIQRELANARDRLQLEGDSYQERKRQFQWDMRVAKLSKARYSLEWKAQTEYYNSVFEQLRTGIATREQLVYAGQQKINTGFLNTENGETRESVLLEIVKANAEIAQFQPIFESMVSALEDMNKAEAFKEVLQGAVTDILTGSKTPGEALGDVSKFMFSGAISEMVDKFTGGFFTKWAAQATGSPIERLQLAEAKLQTYQLRIIAGTAPSPIKPEEPTPPEIQQNRYTNAKQFADKQLTTSIRMPSNKSTSLTKLMPIIGTLSALGISQGNTGESALPGWDAGLSYADAFKAPNTNWQFGDEKIGLDVGSAYPKVASATKVPDTRRKFGYGKTGYQDYLNAGMMLYGSYQNATNPKIDKGTAVLSGMMSGASAGSMFPGAGTIIGAALGGIAALIGVNNRQKEVLEKIFDQMPKRSDLSFAAPQYLPFSAYAGGRAGVQVNIQLGSGVSMTSDSIQEAVRRGLEEGSNRGLSGKTTYAYV